MYRGHTFTAYCCVITSEAAGQTRNALGGGLRLVDTLVLHYTVPLIYRLSETEPFSQFGFVVPSDALAWAY